MQKFNFYDLLGSLADAAVQAKHKKSEQQTPEAPPQKPQVENVPPVRKSLADRKTVVQMIRNHDEKKRQILERQAEKENPDKT